LATFPRKRSETMATTESIVYFEIRDFCKRREVG